MKGNFALKFWRALKAQDVNADRHQRLCPSISDRRAQGYYPDALFDIVILIYISPCREIVQKMASPLFLTLVNRISARPFFIEIIIIGKTRIRIA